MAVSFIKEKLTKLIAKKLPVEQVENWAKSELAKIKNKPQAFCIEYSKQHYGIGNFDIKIQQDGTAKVYNDDKLVHHFQNKQIAIYYSAYEKLHKFTRSTRLLSADLELAKSRADYIILAHRIRNHANADEVEHNIRLAKFQLAYYRLKNAESEFTKILTTAKYNKIWDTLI
jgi:hypothetical protein